MENTFENAFGMDPEYVLITPEMAANLLESNGNNRNLSEGTVKAYANDMLNGNWDYKTGSAISIDENGILRDGQHRLAAIVMSGVTIPTWVIRNVSSDGIYDNNRKRSNSDQISIMKPEYENVYKSTRYISVARQIITHGHFNRRMVTPKEIIDFTDIHKNILDGFFLNIPQGTVPKLSLAVVHLGLFLAYVSGEDMDDILSFYDMLCTGMSTSPVEFPIIAYRNYLLNASGISTTDLEIGRCQYAFKKYLTKSSVKKNMSPKELIYPFPSWGDNKEEA